jgi:membrane protein implicated in regulation of membrane protease activity
MQWVFVVVGLLAALAEMHTGTFYLAGIAAAAIATAGLGFWVFGDGLVYVFVVLCAGVTGLVMLTRRRRMLGRDLADFDIGQTVSVLSISHPGNRLTVGYRGAQWDAVMADGSAAAPGDSAVIARRTDKLLHLVASA